MQIDINILPHIKSDCKSESEDFTTPKQIFSDGLRIGFWELKLDDADKVVALKNQNFRQLNNTRKQLRCNKRK